MDFTNCPVLPGVISKISTNSAGGWSIKIDVPEIAGDIVRQLLGSENKIVYSIALSQMQEIERVERGPGRPKNNN